MKASHSLFFLLLVITSNGFAQPGILDPTFGNNGMVLTTFGTNNTLPRVVQGLPNGQIITLCRVYQSSLDIGLVRYNSDGSLDQTFGTEGTLIIDLNNASVENPSHMEVLSNGKILINGVSDGDLFLLRLNSDGSIDPDFGTNGYVIYDINAGTDDYAGSFAVRPSGEIIMVGYAYDGPGGGSGCVVQFTENGILDDSFGTNGKLQINNVNNIVEILTDIALSPSGDAFVMGSINQLNVTDNVYIYCVSPNGTLNTAFNGIGYKLLAIGDGDDSAGCLAVLSSGKIIVAGITEVENDNPFIVQLEPDGSYDSTFGADGIQILSSIYSLGVTDIHIDPDGKIVLASGTYLEFLSNMLIVRLNTNGSLDTNFGTNGYTTTSAGGSAGTEQGVSLATDSNGNYIMSGITGEPISGSIQQVLLKYGNSINSIAKANQPEPAFYPNPSNGKLWINASSSIPNYKILIRDLSGRTVGEIQMNGDASLELPASLQSGVYLISSDNQVQISTQSIILIR
jgi:uncharacterized delta-60 repeat protein